MNIIRGFPVRGTILRAPNNKDYNILGSILGSPYFGKLPHSEHIPLCPAKPPVNLWASGSGSGREVLGH